MQFIYALTSGMHIAQTLPMAVVRICIEDLKNCVESTYMEIMDCADNSINGIVMVPNMRLYVH
jgi:hypothetical protein